MREHLSQWSQHLVAQRGLAAGTIRSYASAVKEFFDFFPARAEASGPITRQDIDAYMRSLFDRRNANSTRARKLSGLKSFFDWLVYSGHVTVSPVAGVPSPRFAPAQPHPFTTSELRKLISAPDRATLAGRRDLAIIYTLLGAGLRASELLGLDLGDLHDTGAFIRLTVLGKGSKERFILLKRRPAAVLRSWVIERKARPALDDALFIALKGSPTRLGKAGLDHVLTRYAETSGVKDVHPHRFRSSFATMLYNAGHDISKISALCGWSERSGLTTAMRYIKVSDRYLKETAIPDSTFRELETPEGEDNAV